VALKELANATAKISDTCREVLSQFDKYEDKDALIALLREVVAKLDALSALKTVNAEKEAEVLGLLVKELNR